MVDHVGSRQGAEHDEPHVIKTNILPPVQVVPGAPPANIEAMRTALKRVKFIDRVKQGGAPSAPRRGSSDFVPRGRLRSMRQCSAHAFTAKPSNSAHSTNGLSSDCLRTGWRHARRVSGQTTSELSAWISAGLLNLFA
jgi:hypothetical protein